MALEPASPRQQDQPPGPERRVRLALTGDVMLGRLVNEALGALGPRYVWGNTLPVLRQAELAIANLECVVAADGVPWRRTPKVFHFRADPVAIEALQVAGMDAVSLANNHVLDFETAAFLEMLDRLDAAGIARAGAGRDLTEAARPAVLQSDDIRVALIALTDNQPEWAATTAGPGINYVPITTDQPYFSAVRQSVEAARAGGADLVICSAHWGPNMRQRPTSIFRRFARAVLDAGADLFCGHSAHIFQGVEFYHSKPILYDLGDFVDDYAVDVDLRNDQSLLVLATLTKHGVREVEALPVRIDDCQVNLAERDDFEQIAARLESLSAEMGTDVLQVDGHLRLLSATEDKAA